MNLKRLLNAIVVPLLFIVGQVLGQERTVTGSVTDTSGTPIANASVVVKGAGAGTQTGSDGSFTLRVPPNARTLTVSFVGYPSRDVPITAGNISVVLQSNAATTLNEVVVVGYGTQRRKDLTSAVATVTSKDFQKGNITTPEQLIAGKVAGVSIIGNSGRPGSGSTIRVRGGSSLNASNDPLIVIDGVPLDNGSIPGASNPLSFINPNDIESFSILKDASAAAIYGTRAANGVIIITTKKGRSGAFKANFSTVNSVSSVIKTVDVLSADQVRSIINAVGLPKHKALLGTANTNWQDEIYQTAFATDNNLSFTGGIKKLPYRASIGYLNQQGILMTDKLQRFSGSIAVNPSFLDNHLKLDLNLKGSVQKYRFADEGAIGGAIYFDPTQPVYTNGKRYGGYFEWVNAAGTLNLNSARNPVARLNQTEDISNTKRSIGNAQLDYKFHFLPELRANLNLGYDVSEGTGSKFISDSAAVEYRNQGLSSEYRQTKQNSVVEFYLNYASDIRSIKSRIDLLAGYSYNNFVTTTYNFATYNARGQKRPNSDPVFPFDKPENTLISYFGRANYTLNNKYLLTATIRRDGSSRFAPANRWGVFPSVAVAWKLNEEDFLKNNTVVSDLKLRASYGITGQQEGIGNYDYLSYYSLSSPTSTYGFGNTYYQMFRPGGFYANRKWEETETYNVALDYGFANNRINGSIDFYHKTTSNLLNRIPQPAGTNFAAYILANVGSMQNKGVEFSINTQPVRNANITWDVAFNVTYNKNTITNLTVIPDDPNYIGFPSTNINGASGFAYINAVGTSKNTFYLYHQIYDQLGNPVEGLFEDVNRDGIINESDKYKGKGADPKTFFGASTNLSVKNWNAGFVMRASVGNYVYNNIYSNNGRLNQLLGAEVTGNASVNYLTTRFTGNTDQQLLSDYYIENASFLRMDNLNIGYNFGKVLHNKTSLRANLTVQNVFVVTKYNGLDPEISNGVDNNFYPRPRVFSLGLNLDF